MSDTSDDDMSVCSKQVPLRLSMPHISFVNSNLIVKTATQKVNAKGLSTYTFTYERSTNSTISNIQKAAAKCFKDLPLHGTSAISVMGKQPTPPPVYSTSLSATKPTAKRTGGKPSAAHATKKIAADKPMLNPTMQAPVIPKPSKQRAKNDNALFRELQQTKAKKSPNSVRTNTSRARRTKRRAEERAAAAQRAATQQPTQQPTDKPAD